MSHPEAKPNPLNRLVAERFGADFKAEEFLNFYRDAVEAEQADLLSILDSRVKQVAIENPSLAIAIYKGEFRVEQEGLVNDGPEGIMSDVREIIEQNNETGNKILVELLLDKDVGDRAYDGLVYYLEPGSEEWLEKIMPALNEYFERRNDES